MSTPKSANTALSTASWIIFLFSVYLIAASCSKATAQDINTDYPAAVFTGNSITHFWITKDSTFFETNNFVDVGISGYTSFQILQRFDDDVVKKAPKVVVISAGINDIAENQGAVSNDFIIRNIDSMVVRAKEAQIIPLIASILPCDHFYWNPKIKPAQRVVEVNKLLQDLAKKHGIIYIDYYTPMATDSGALNDNYTLDGCHPNKAGYMIMEPIVVEAIAKAINEKTSTYYVTTKEKQV